MGYELLEQGQAENIAVIAASLIITMLAYCAFPLIFATARKKTITKKKYRILCYCVNFAVWMMFIAFNGTSSGAPYILWTAVFSALGVKMLKSKGALNECQPTDSTSSGAQSVDTCSVSDDMAVTEKSIPAIEEVPDTEEKPSNKFLQSCGSELTEDSPLCPSYDKKQDDKKSDGKDSINIIIPKRTITIVLLSVIFAGLLGFNIWQYKKISDLENEREKIISELEKVKELNNDWQIKYDEAEEKIDELNENLDYYQRYIEIYNNTHSVSPISGNSGSAYTNKTAADWLAEWTIYVSQRDSNSENNSNNGRSVDTNKTAADYAAEWAVYREELISELNNGSNNNGGNNNSNNSGSVDKFLTAADYAANWEVVKEKYISQMNNGSNNNGGNNSNSGNDASSSNNGRTTNSPLHEEWERNHSLKNCN